MGLDMYLTKRTYVKNWDHKTEKYSISAKKDGKSFGIKPSRVTYIIEEVAYWRKANHIHKWFVDNVQEGEDDCKEYEVSTEELAKLVEICKEILKTAEIVTGKITSGQKLINGIWEDQCIDGKYIKNPAIADKLLPTQGGFFFGSTTYDQYYIGDLEYTIKALEQILKECAEEKEYPEFFYQSSW